MTKEEKIKEAWGYAWDFIDGHVKENALYYGWVHKLNINIHFNELNIELQQHYTDEWLYRPKSLQGIGDNNGWFTLNNVAKEIPIEIDNIELYNINTCEYYISTDTHEFIEIERFTHWKPLEKSKYPLFKL